MYLKRIEIQGFKSFARKTVLEFAPGIVAVVGPNGSGKSNFSDAIRWVLGEQSMKAVRSKKSEDVIFAGSDKKARLGMAEAVIVFDNEDRRLPLDFSEVAVARRLFRDGESEYLINNSAVRLMDVVELLSKSGYGNSSYQVISQGSIDQLVLAGPAAIKSLVEEAVGIKPYYLKRERAARKLERTEQNLLRVADLVAEIEPRLRSLKRQAKRMQARDELVSQLRILQKQHFSARYHKLAATVAERQGRVAYFDKEIQDLSAELLSLTEEIKILERSGVERTSAYSRLQEDLRKVEQEKNSVQEQLAITRGQLKAGVPGGRDQKNLLLQEQSIKTSLRTLNGHLESLVAQSALSEKNLAQHKKIYESQSRETQKLKAQIDALRNPVDLGKLKEEVEKIYSRYQSLLYQIKNLHSEEDFQHLQEDANNLEIVLVKLKDKVAQATGSQLNHTELIQLNGELQKMFEKREGVQKELAGIEAHIQTAIAKKRFYAEQAAALQTELTRVAKMLKQEEFADPGRAWRALSAQEKDLTDKLRVYFSGIEKMEADLKNFIVAESAQKKDLLQKEHKLRDKQDTIGKLKDQRGLVLIEKARDEQALESIYAEIRKDLGNEFVEQVRQSPPAPVEGGLESKILKLKVQLEQAGGVDELTLQEYRETLQRYNHLVSQSSDLKKAVADLKEVITELDGLIKKEFSLGFDKVNDHFSEYFRILFSGGRARMSLVKEQRLLPSEENGQGEKQEGEEQEPAGLDVARPNPQFGREEVSGIEIRATPPGKKLALLSALSGGERTMTAIALLMAILTAFPSPFVVLDEVDAALDEANSIRFGKILSKLAHQTQFITITHNRETMRYASLLYGVTMGEEGISKVLSIKLDKAVAIAA